MKQSGWFCLGIALALVATACTGAVAGAPHQRDVLLATTTSTYDSGLLDVLIPPFEQQTGYRVKPIAVGSGQALALGARGEADVLLVHSPEAEQELVAAGHGSDRRLVMHNDFVLVGPSNDPAGVRGLSSATEALSRIAASGALFLSRGDKSGTHALEMALWQRAGIDPAGQTWYQESGQGMGQTLNIAVEKGAYALADRGTLLTRPPSPDQVILLEGDPALFNIYHVILVDAERHPGVNQAGARAFADYLTSAGAQELIGEYARDRHGEPLFVPDAQSKTASPST